MRIHLALLAVLGCSSAPRHESPDAPPAPDAPADASPGAPLPALPLQASSRWILDANGKRLKLVAVSWYGTDSPDYVVAGLDHVRLDDLAAEIRALGFDAVRLPWSNEMFESDPPVAAARLAANPALQGKRALDVLDAVIAALAHQGLVVILDNHVSTADWCCSDSDGQGLWYTPAYPESSWIADWQGMAARYATQPAVIGADLRNEPRPANGVTPTWGGTDPTTDWRGAAQRAGNAVLGVAPSWLIFVEGLNYSADFTGAYTNPIALALPGRLVYTPHDYASYHPGLTSYADLKTALGDAWGFLLVQGQPYTAPVWLGEFGTCHTSASCVDDTAGQGLWFAGIRMYLTEADIDWSYWPLNGTEATGTSRTLGAEDSYGVLDPAWTQPALPALTSALQAIEPVTQMPD